MFMVLNGNVHDTMYTKIIEAMKMASKWICDVYRWIPMLVWPCRSLRSSRWHQVTTLMRGGGVGIVRETPGFRLWQDLLVGQVITTRHTVWCEDSDDDEVSLIIMGVRVLGFIWISWTFSCTLSWTRKLCTWQADLLTYIRQKRGSTV